MWWWLAAAAVLVVGAVGVGAVLAGRRGDALRQLCQLVPDCVVLLRDLLRDPEVPLVSKALVWSTVAYLAMPIDLIPDVVPVLGLLDDALLVALVLRRLARTAGTDRVRQHWRGDPLVIERILAWSGVP